MGFCVLTQFADTEKQKGCTQRLEPSMLGNEISNAGPRAEEAAQLSRSLSYSGHVRSIRISPDATPLPFATRRITMLWQPKLTTQYYHY